MRPLVSYDDISQPAPVAVSSQRTQFGQQPPNKKRKRTNQKPLKQQAQQVQHWDDPGDPDGCVSYTEGAINREIVSSVVAEEEPDEDEESRELTHDEIWDDSALIDAWNAATEEYEVFHGPEKGWKKEPTHKSPLWYNIPPSPSTLKKSQAATAASVTARQPGFSVEPMNAEGDSQPLNFDTFVPSHDPSLSLPAPPYPAGGQPDYAGYRPASPSEPMVSQDEAFTRAMGAMYWAGYYTAVYHHHRRVEEEAEEGEGQEEFEEDEGLVSTQR